MQDRHLISNSRLSTGISFLSYQTMNNELAYVGEFTSRRRRVDVGEFARRRVDRIPTYQLIMPNLNTIYLQGFVIGEQKIRLHLSKISR